MQTARTVRLIRGAAAASVATFMALLSHVAGGAAMPGWVGVAVPWIFSLMACTLLAGRASSLLRLTVGVAISQTLFHALFVLGTVAPGGTADLGVSDHLHGMAPPAAMTSTPAVASTMSMMSADPTMWCWHGIAAIVTIAALYRGERAVLRLLRLAAELRSWVRTALRRPVPAFAARPAPRRIAHAPGTLAVPRLRLFLSALGRRGPPQTTAV
ncbi:MAG: hypothetical protein JST25_14500 [Actinobacteria bacterium]|nr:hypothetical protein [Actinomycetota bacterium]